MSTTETDFSNENQIEHKKTSIESETTPQQTSPEVRTPTPRENSEPNSLDENIIVLNDEKGASHDQPNKQMSPNMNTDDGRTKNTNSMETIKGQLIYMNKKVDISLTTNSIIIGEKNCIPFYDIYSIKHADDERSFIVYTAIQLKKQLRRVNHKFTCSSKEECASWVTNIRMRVFRVEKENIRDRRLLVIINPFSGDKKGAKKFEKKIKPIFDVSQLKYEICYTKSPKHATQIAKEADFTKYDEIVAVGGDGTLFEVVQGLMQRDDWQEVVRRPIGIIPLGTSNGIAADVCGEGTFSAEKAAIVIARGFYKPLDIVSIIQNGKRFYSFLSLSWSIIADVDMGADSFRWLGEIRNPLVAIKCVLQRNYYSGTLKFIKAENPEQSNELYNAFAKEMDTSPKFEVSKSPFTVLNKGPSCPLLESHFVEDLSKHSDKLQNVELVQPTNPMKSIQVVKDKFGYFMVCNVPHIASDMIAAPHAKFCDGTADIMYIRYCISRFKMLYLFTEMEKGTYINRPYVEHHKVQAFVLEPESKGSYIAVDGEKMEYKQVLGEVHKGLLRIFCDEKIKI